MLVLGIVSVGNVTLSSLLRRIHEVGLRRALGPRPGYIVAHILLDAGVTGVIGGVLGAFVAGICPVRVTSRLQPNEALRRE